MESIARERESRNLMQSFGDKMPIGVALSDMHVRCLAGLGKDARGWVSLRASFFERHGRLFDAVTWTGKEHCTLRRIAHTCHTSADKRRVGMIFCF